MSRRALAAGAVFAALAAALFFLGRAGVRESATSFLEWVDSLGAWGPLLVAAVYVVATVLLVPGVILTLGAGFLFGAVVGTITISIGSTLGASAAFLLGRTILRERVAGWIAGRPRVAALDAAAARKGFLIVLLTRLSPAFPFILLNYAYGVTQVRFRDFFLASWIGMLPGTVFFIYLGTTLGSLAEVAAGRVDPGLPAKLVGLGLTLVATVFVTRLATRALAREMPEARR